MKEHFWHILLQLSRSLPHNDTFRWCGLSVQTSNFRIFFDDLPSGEKLDVLITFDSNTPSVISTDCVHFRCHSILNYELIQEGIIDRDFLNLLKIYLPYCFLKRFAYSEKRAIAAGHFAQSLDGRIATHSGDSKWIGNTENLIHAHRMRALCDGILIGKQTLLLDNPKLTVRHVDGPHPKRIVIGTGIEHCNSLLEALQEKVLIFERETHHLNGEFIQRITPPDPESFNCSFILETLYQMGIYSVLIEGGPQTTSRFLEHQLLDIVQLHIAPLILGSGRTGFQLPRIDQISEAITFSYFDFVQIGDTFMFSGTPK